MPSKHFGPVAVLQPSVIAGEEPLGTTNAVRSEVAVSRWRSSGVHGEDRRHPRSALAVGILYGGGRLKAKPHAQRAEP